MIETRKKHCSFARLNRSGRCIADCWMNREREFCSDCTGKNAQAHPTLDYAALHEARVSHGFIDGRGIQVDSKGYAVPVPKVVESITLGRRYSPYDV